MNHPVVGERVAVSAYRSRFDGLEGIFTGRSGGSSYRVEFDTGEWAFFQLGEIQAIAALGGEA